MRKWLITALIISILCTGCSTKTNSSEANTSQFGLQAEKYSKDFNSDNNQAIIFHNVSFEIPESWTEKEGDENILYFYPENGMFMVMYDEADIDILKEDEQKNYIEGISSECDYFMLTDSNSYVGKNREGYRFEANVVLNQKQIIWDSVVFPTDGGIISFTMGTYVDGQYNYINDYQNIFASILFKDNLALNDETKNTQQSPPDETKTPEANTSEMVDYLIEKAKNDIQEVSDSDLLSALEYIRDNIDNCWDSNEVMEKFIYYGSVLEIYYKGYNTNADIRGRIGMDAVQLVKYVYRNTETTDSKHSRENLQQVKESLEEYYSNK